MKKEDQARNILISIVIVIIIFLLAVFYIRRRQANQITSTPLPTPISQYEQQLEQNFGIKVPDNVTKIDLKDVTGGSQMGLATMSFENGTYNYTVMANLEDPMPGYFYQAWLVKFNDVISLGKMENGKGGWIVNYQTSKNISDYKGVMVTLKKSSDSTIGKPILEGNFQ